VPSTAETLKIPAADIGVALLASAQVSELVCPDATIGINPITHKISKTLFIIYWFINSNLITINCK
jgi:hypothetical protein